MRQRARRSEGTASGTQARSLLPMETRCSRLWESCPRRERGANPEGGSGPTLGHPENAIQRAVLLRVCAPGSEWSRPPGQQSVVAYLCRGQCPLLGKRAQESKEVPLQGQRVRARRAAGPRMPLWTPPQGTGRAGCTQSVGHASALPCSRTTGWPHTCVCSCLRAHTPHTQAHRCPKAYDQRAAHAAGL